MIEAARFRAMGTDDRAVRSIRAERDGERASTPAEAEFERLEQIMSRFRPDSELSHLNRDGVLEAISRPRRTSSRSRSLRASGRRPLRSDRPRRARRRGVRPHVRGRCRRGRRRARRTASVRRRASPSTAGTIELEPGTRLDLGGIGKGYAVERVADLLR